VLAWDCTWKGLTSLPPEIGCLTNLRVLNCGNNELTSLPSEIGHLINLRVLECWGNQLDSKTREAMKKILVRNKEGDPRDVLVLILLHDFLGNIFPFQLSDQILLHCRVQWFCDDMGLQ